MDYLLDLSNVETNRFLIIGNALGDYRRVMSFLYQQNFSWKDTLIFTGNMINPEGDSADLLRFVKNVLNGYSVIGNNEVDFLQAITDPEKVPVWFRELPDKEEIIKYLEGLPSITRISDYFYIVNSGIDPSKDVSTQEPRVYYSIKGYDEFSRYYQFNNPEKKSWFDYEILEQDKPIKLFFSNLKTLTTEVSGGYSLYREPDQKMKCVILRKGTDKPILIEA